MERRTGRQYITEKLLIQTFSLCVKWQSFLQVIFTIKKIIFQYFKSLMKKISHVYFIAVLYFLLSKKVMIPTM